MRIISYNMHYLLILSNWKVLRMPFASNSELKQIISTLSISSLLVLLLFIATPQESAVLNLAMGLLSFLFLIPILLIGNPFLQAKLDFRYHWLAPIYSVFLPPAILFLTTGEIFLLDQIAIWYLLPAIILLLPKLLEFRLSPLNSGVKTGIYVVGAAILWIGFDHRFTVGIFAAFKDLGYLMNAFWMACVGFTTYGIEEGIHNAQHKQDRGLLPSLHSLQVTNKYTLLASIFIIPLGFLTGFLVWHPVLEPVAIFVSFFGIFFTIAIQEEMIFRAIILKELDKYSESSRYQVLGLIVVSILFALTHWNNEEGIFILVYFGLATIAGIAYGLCYRKGGFFSAVLSHTLVDWLAQLLLGR